ncbi:MAG: amidohydrolase [Bacteroidales bacterium]|jgi:omega-amidase
MQDLTVTLVQTFLHWGDREKNLAHLAEKLEDIPSTDLIILPEMFTTGFITDPTGVAEEMDGPAMGWMREMAFQKKAYLLGSLSMKVGEKYYNRMICMAPDGSYAQYDKRHPFRMGGEHLKFSKGNKRGIFAVKGWNVLPLICYDLRFPVWCKNTFSGGRHAFDLIICVANWPEVRSQAWTLLLKARAIDNQCYTIGVNRIGEDGNGISHSGDSAVSDPRGKIITGIEPHTEAVVTLTISRKELDEFRAAFPVGLDWDAFTIPEIE